MLSNIDWQQLLERSGILSTDLAEEEVLILKGSSINQSDQYDCIGTDTQFFTNEQKCKHASMS